jgi:dTDP-4-dehydrorhamnose reductase
MKTLLITGATGLLGSALARHDAAHSYRVTGFSHVPSKAPGAIMQRFFDLTNRELTLEHLNDLGPEIVIHCAAMTNVDLCEKEPDAARRTNVEVTRTIVQWAARRGTRLVFISTDSVFDGGTGNYQEDDTTHPVNEYARTKVAAEEIVRSAIPDALVVRTNFYGRSWKEGKPSLGEWMLGKLLRKECFSAFSDVRFSPLLTIDLAGIVFDLLARNASGIFHVAARDNRSKYEFARLLANTFSLDCGYVSPISVGEFTLAAPRPKDTTMSVKKIAGFLGRATPSVEEGLLSFRGLFDERRIAVLQDRPVDSLAKASAR